MKCAQSFSNWLFVLCIVLVSCNNSSKPPASQVISPANLPAQYFTINTETDTTLVTQEGIKIHIPGGSIQYATKQVTVVIKEALSLFDMLNGGLTTMSGKELLRSNGMFYIATKEASTIVKPIQVEVPAVYADTSMQLYNGVKDDGRIDWRNPKPVQSSDTAHCDGRSFFNNNCASCHVVGKKLTGPALANVEKRWSNRQHLIEFIRNNQSLIQSGKCSYAICHYNEYNKTPMNVFPSLTDADIECVLKYIRRETERLGMMELPGKSKDAVNDANWTYYQQLQNKREEYIENNGPKVELNRKYDVDSPISINIDTIRFIFSDKVSPPRENAEYYKLSINTFGWYNIDAGMDRPDFFNSKLIVKKKGDYEGDINMFLVIPSHKIFTEGGLLENEADYGFYDRNGSIPLPLNKDAFIIAIGEKGGNLFYGQRHFTTEVEQTIHVTVHAIDKKDLAEKLKKLQLDDVSFGVTYTKHFADMIHLDQEIARLKDKLRNVGCSRCEDGNDFAPVPSLK